MPNEASNMIAMLASGKMPEAELQNKILFAYLQIAKLISAQ